MCLCADKGQLMGMAAAFASLPCKVLWRLTPKEIPDAAAVDELQLGNNTKVCLSDGTFPHLTS